MWSTSPIKNKQNKKKTHNHQQQRQCLCIQVTMDITAPCDLLKDVCAWRLQLNRRRHNKSNSACAMDT